MHAALFALLLYRHPVPALFAFFLWNVLTAFGPRLLGLVLGALPVLALVGMGALAWSRGVVAGVHPAVWELVLARRRRRAGPRVRAASGVAGQGREASGRKEGPAQALRGQRGRPPAMAGTMVTVSPALSGVFLPSRKRMSSSFRNTRT